MSPDFVLQLIIAVFAAVTAGAGVYAAIKSDLTKAIITAENARDESKDTTKRLNNHLEFHHERRTAP